jgi:hypothetical protein
MVLGREQYLSLVSRLIQVVAEGTFSAVQFDCPLEEMFEIPMPGDCISHEFRCAECGQGFSLWADTYHGNARWLPWIPREEIGWLDQRKPN